LPVLVRVNSIETGICSVPFDQIIINKADADNWLFVPSSACEISLIDTQGFILDRWLLPAAKSPPTKQ